MSLTERLGDKACDYQIMSRELYSHIRGEKRYPGSINGHDYPIVASSISLASRIFLFSYIDALANERK